MARDRKGYLSWAREATRRAIRLAQTPRDLYRVTAWQARLACDTGHHREELQCARRLMELEPRDERSLHWLRRAARHNGSKELEQQADRQLRMLPSPSGPREYNGSVYPDRSRRSPGFSFPMITPAARMSKVESDQQP
jgi:hypothetical protein